MMHGLKQLVYDNQPFFSSNQTGKTNRELYILWKQNKRDDIFLLLYTQLWMVLEEVYMENVIDYYKKDCYEKKLFFELVEYQKRFFKKNIKIQLLTGYFYATTEYLFFLNKENDIYNIVDEGKNIIKKHYCTIYNGYATILKTNKKFDDNLNISESELLIFDAVNEMQMESIDNILDRLPKLTELMIESFVDSRYFDRSYMVNNLDSNEVSNEECQNLLFKVDAYYSRKQEIINKENCGKSMS